MKLSEILQLDLRVKENHEALSEALLKLPFFGRKPSVDELELAVWKMQKKYPVRLSYVMPSTIEDQFYSFMIKNWNTNEWLKTIYAMTMYEGFAKTALYMFGYIQKLKKESQNED